MSDLDSCRQIAERELQQQGLLDYNVVQHIDTWDDAVLQEYARSGEVAGLPRVHSSVRDLAGKPLLVYETVTDEKERLTMTDDEQTNSWFAVGAIVIGESGSSNQKEPAVIVMTNTGEGLPPAQAVSFQVSDLHATLQDGVVSMRRENKSKVDAKRVAVLVASKSVAAKYAGRNFSNMSYKSWLGIQQATQAVWKKAEVANKLGT